MFWRNKLDVKMKPVFVFMLSNFQYLCLINKLRPCTCVRNSYLKMPKGAGYVPYRVHGLNCMTFVLKAAADNVH